MNVSTTSASDGSRTNAAASARALTASRIRSTVPRLRKSGKASGTGFCLIIDRIGFGPRKVRAGIAGGSGINPIVGIRHPGRKRRSCRDFRFADPTQPVPAPRTAALTPPPLTSWPTPPPRPRRRRLVRPVRRADVRLGPALQRLGRLRPASRRRRHRRVARACPDARPPSACSPATTSRPSSAAWRRSAPRSSAAPSPGRGDLEDVHLNIEKRLTALVGDAGKRLHTARSRNDQIATDIRLWLRGAIDGLSASWPRCGARCSTWPSATPRHDHAGLHPPAGRAAGHLRPPPAGLRGDARAGQRAAGRLPAAGQPPAAGCRRARRDELPDRPRPGGARTGLRRRVRQFARRGVGSRLRHRIRGRRGADHGPPVALRRGADPVVEPALRLRRTRRPLLHRQLDHAAEEESRTSRAGPRQDRRASPAIWSACSC